MSIRASLGSMDRDVRAQDPCGASSLAFFRGSILFRIGIGNIIILMFGLWIDIIFYIKIIDQNTPALPGSAPYLMTNKAATFHQVFLLLLALGGLSRLDRFRYYQSPWVQLIVCPYWALS